jgi:N-acetylglutamate synthase-like GNAT family acetyltransferase
LTDYDQKPAHLYQRQRFDEEIIIEIDRKWPSMEKITTNKASQNGVRALSRKLTELLKDKSSQIYQDNVTKFGIPEKYVRQAFSEKTMPETATSGKSEFYLALENSSKILGFAQMAQKNESLAELDRIVIFPENTRKGIRTQLLSKVLAEQKRMRTIIVNAGKEENHARRSYEKNGFKPTIETTIETPWGNKLAPVTYQLEIGSQ